VFFSNRPAFPGTIPQFSPIYGGYFFFASEFLQIFSKINYLPSQKGGYIMNEKKLTKKEKEFCRWYVRLRNPREAALRSGFTILPEHRALSLLGKRIIREKISELEKENHADKNLVSAGLERLAFGSVSDAINLILCVNDNKSPDIDSLDLFNVSEIKITNGKGMEIKFFDRLKALERLSVLSCDDGNEGMLSFYEAIEKSASHSLGVEK
jgi:hypothetical protein